MWLKYSNKYTSVLKAGLNQALGFHQFVFVYEIDGEKMDDRSDVFENLRNCSHKIAQNSGMNNNIAGFDLPAKSSGQTYRSNLKEFFRRYIKRISEPDFNYDPELSVEVKHICIALLECFDLCHTDRASAERKLSEILVEFLDNKFLVSELNQSYAFRAITPFENQESENWKDIYKEMKEEELTFFRVRDSDPNSDDIHCLKDIVHCPASKCKEPSKNRFNPPQIPALYLSVTSFVCYKEIKTPENANKDFYYSVFKPNEFGQKLKILNLTGSQSVINGVYSRLIDPYCAQELQSALIKIFPLVIATSFEVAKDNKNTEFVDEYIISQMLSKIIHEKHIDGIAYLSMKGEDEFQYPEGVDLVLPAFDVNECKEYGQCCYDFYITKPVKYNSQSGGNENSYINKAFKAFKKVTDFEKLDFYRKKLSYTDSDYGKFDDFLVSQDFFEFKWPLKDSIVTNCGNI